MAPSERIWFIHIPKTAGKVVDRLLRGRFAKDAICPSFWADEYLERGLKLADSPYRVFLGHVPYFFRPLLPEPMFVFTYLRDPIERTLSAFKHIRRDANHPNHELLVKEAPTILDFVRHPKLRTHIANVQCRMLGDGETVPSGHSTGPAILERISRLANNFPYSDADLQTLERAKQRLCAMRFFGLQDRFSESCSLLCTFLALKRPRKIPRIDVAPVAQEPQIQTLTDNERDAICEATRFDVELYEYARNLFISRAAESRP